MEKVEIDVVDDLIDACNITILQEYQQSVQSRTMGSLLHFATFDVTKRVSCYGTHRRQVFYQSRLSLALVNLKPLVPGHVLVVPKRHVVSRLKDLSSDEITDLFNVVQKVGKVVEQVYQGQSLTVAIQDGPFAGQSVPHLHVHIMPRKLGDFTPMDKIYQHMDTQDIENDFHQSKLAFQSTRQQTEQQSDHVEQNTFHVDNDSRKPRTLEEMEEEAKMLSTYF